MTEKSKPIPNAYEIADLLAERDAERALAFTPPRPDMHTITEDDDADQVSGAWGILAGVLIGMALLAAAAWVAG